MRYKRPLDPVNVVANVMTWAASGHCGLAGSALISMLVTEGHMVVLRKTPVDAWLRLGSLLGATESVRSGSHEAIDDDGPFNAAGRRAIESALRAAGAVPSWPPPDDRIRLRAARMKQEARDAVAEQVHLLSLDLDRRGWSPADHADFPPRFRATVRTLLMASRTEGCVLLRLPTEVVHHLIAVLAQCTFWNAAPRDAEPSDTARLFQSLSLGKPAVEAS